LKHLHVTVNQSQRRTFYVKIKLIKSRLQQYHELAEVRESSPVLYRLVNVVVIREQNIQAYKVDETPVITGTA